MCWKDHDDSLGSENTLLNNSEADDTFESVNESVSAVDGANFSVSSDGNDTTTPYDDETALIHCVWYYQLHNGWRDYLCRTCAVLVLCDRRSNHF